MSRCLRLTVSEKTQALCTRATRGDDELSAAPACTVAEKLFTVCAALGHGLCGLDRVPAIVQQCSANSSYAHLSHLSASSAVLHLTAVSGGTCLDRLNIALASRVSR